MRYDLPNDRLTLSATDLANHQRCERLVQLDRQRAIAVARGEVVVEQEDSLAARKGREFEEQVVAALLAETAAAGQTAVDLRGDHLDARQRRAALESAIVSGAHVIVQAPLRAGRLGGVADLLLRTPADGTQPAGTLATVHRYEPVEIKYARSVRPAFVLQTCAYAAVLEQLCGEAPAALHVWTGDGARHTFATADFAAHYRAAAAQLEDAMSVDIAAALEPTPPRIGHCDGCRWASECGARRRAVDHPSLVAGIRRTQVDKLAGEGITTVAGLAATDIERIPGIGAATLARLAEQARLQVAARVPGATGPGWSFRAPDREGRGFALLPEPDAADMFFDFEGYPYHESGALEYLWGWSELAGGVRTPGHAAGIELAGSSPATRFLGHWCDTTEEECAAFAAFLAYVTARRAACPGMHVYHYAPYEVTQLKRLADLHPQHWPALTPLLREGVFIDLYAVVAQSMLIGTESYSIKYLEPLYGFDRDGADVATAGASIEEYERWVDSGDTRVRDAIIAYNRDDCDSTLALRDWLLERRAEALAGGIEWRPANAAPEPDEATEEQLAQRAEQARIISLLTDVGEGDLPASCASFSPELRTDVAAAARLLAAMPGWGWREQRQFLGELHGMKHARDEGDMVDDPTMMGGLVLEVTQQLSADTTLRTWRGPVQDSLVKAGNAAYDPIAAVCIGTVEWADPDAGTICIRTTKAPQARLDARGGFRWEELTAVLGRTEIFLGDVEARPCRLGAAFLEALDQGVDPFFEAGSPHRAALTLLARRMPVVSHLELGAPIHDRASGAPTPIELADLVEGLEHSTLVVQGPPGTGKTWITARAIAELVSRGLRVGISSNSHAAIRHLLTKLDEHLDEASAPAASRGLTVAYSPGSREAWEEAPARVHQSSSAKARALLADGGAEVLAGTAWMFAGLDEPIDAIFIDEAGQLSLLHTSAIAAATSRLVLVGDPQQLAQPSPIVHPANAQRSPLDLIFDGADTLAPEHGLLLPITRRMHPGVATWISDTFYDGLVEAHAPTNLHAIDCASMPELSGAGLRIAPVMHEGCSTESAEEAARIVQLFRALLDSSTTMVDHVQETGAATQPRSLTLDDVIVVAPYNRQVLRIRTALDDAGFRGARVGTVDSFQGREAAVAIWSVTASSAEDVPRGLDFLLSPNRMNVAISRARTLAIVVASPTLLGTSCATIDDMRLVNRLQLFAERAQVGGVTLAVPSRAEELDCAT